MVRVGKDIKDHLVPMLLPWRQENMKTSVPNITSRAPAQFLAQNMKDTTSVSLM